MDLSFPRPDPDAATPADALSPSERAALAAAVADAASAGSGLPVAGAFNPAMAARLVDWRRGRGGGSP